MGVPYSIFCCQIERLEALIVASAGGTYTGSNGVQLVALDFQADATIARLSNPALTGVPVAPTAAPGTNTVQLATTAFVVAADALKANLASPALTGVPTAPTASVDTNTTQIATTAFVLANAVTKTNTTIVPEGPAADIDLNINGKGIGVVKTKTLEIGFRTVPSNSRSAAYTTVLEDSGKAIDHPVSDNNARAFTIDGSLAYPIGTCITFVNMAAAACTIPITTDTMYLAGTGTTGTRTLAQFGVATARKHAAGIWLISGVGLT